MEKENEHLVRSDPGPSRAKPAVQRVIAEGFDQWDRRLERALWDRACSETQRRQHESPPTVGSLPSWAENGTHAAPAGAA